MYHEAVSLELRFKRLLGSFGYQMRQVPAAAWLGLAFALRAAFALKLGDAFYQTDELGFHAVALNLARTGAMTQNGAPVAAAPLPTAFFALFYAAFGDRPLLPRLAQAAVSTATAWLIGRLAEEVSGSARAGRLALTLSCAYPFFVYYSAVLMSETLYVAGVVAALIFTARALKSGAPRAAAAAGLCWSLAALTRVEAAPIALLVWLACALSLPSKTLAAGILAWLLPILSWCARNQAAIGSFTLDNHGGSTLLHGTLLHDLSQEQDTSTAMAQVEREAWYQETQRLPEAERQRVYRDHALSFMREHPATTLRQWGEKLWLFWRPWPRTDKAYHGPDGHSPDAGAKRWMLVIISLLFEPWLIALGFSGLWVLRRRPESRPLWLFLIGSTGIHVLIVSMMRYRLACMPLLIAGWASRNRD